MQDTLTATAAFGDRKLPEATPRQRWRVTLRMITATVALAMLTVVLSGVVQPTRAEAASNSVEPFGQHIVCTGVYPFNKVATVYTGAFINTNRTVVYNPNQVNAHFWVKVTDHYTGQRVWNNGWYRGAPLRTPLLGSGSYAIWVWTAWQDPGLGNAWTNTGKWEYVGTCW